MPQSNTGTKLDGFDRKILAYLLKEDWPVTTEMVADAVPSSWNTAQLHLYKLVSEGLVKGKRVGRQNQWMLTDKARARELKDLGSAGGSSTQRTSPSSFGDTK